MASAAKKQVVLLMTDTTRYDMLGCVTPGIATPNLDNLASRGIRFNRAYTCQPVCGPARSAIFTGLYPHTNGCWGNNLPLYANAATIGKRLADQGIPAGYIGKWHLDGTDYFGNGFCPEGFLPDYWYDMRTYLMELSPADRYRSRRMAAMYEDGGIPAEFTYGRRCSDRAIRFLKEFAGRDFFLTVSYDEPHGPSLCPEPYASMYRNYDFPKAPNVWDTLEGKPAYQRYWAGKAAESDRDALKIRPAALLGCNSFVDDEIGRVLAAIREQAPDALIIFTSDHGDALQSHCLSGKACSVYDEMARVPLIVTGGSGSPEGQVLSGVVSDRPVSHINLVPTILEYLGLPVPRRLEGRSLLPACHDIKTDVNGCVFMEFGRYEVIHDQMGGLQLMRGVFDGRYKMAVNLMDTDELYDLETDPWEMVNLIHSTVPEHRQMALHLHDRILQWMNDTRDPFRGYQWGIRHWRPDYMPPKGLWMLEGMSRQMENEEYEPRQLEYWTGLPITGPVEVPNQPLSAEELETRLKAL